MNVKDDLDSIVYAERIDTIKVFLDNHGWIYNVDKAGTKIRYRVLSFGEKSKERITLDIILEGRDCRIAALIPTKLSDQDAERIVQSVKLDKDTFGMLVYRAFEKLFIYEHQIITDHLLSLDLLSIDTTRLLIRAVGICMKVAVSSGIYH